MKRLVGVILLAALAMTGCSAAGVEPSASPTTTYTDARGEEVTVDWVDYPAHARLDGEALLGRPDQTAIEPEARALIHDLQAAIARVSGLEMHSGVPEGEWFGEHWFPEKGNGYGGDSLLMTINCCQMVTTEAPDPEQWRAVLDAASEVTVTAGLGPLVVEQDSAEMKVDPIKQRQFREHMCNGEGGECWRWSARAYDDVQWVEFSIQDAALDRTGEAATWAKDAGVPFDFIRLSYGATVVASGQSAAFARAIEPFRGLTRPAATTSD